MDLKTKYLSHFLKWVFLHERKKLQQQECFCSFQLHLIYLMAKLCFSVRVSPSMEDWERSSPPLKNKTFSPDKLTCLPRSTPPPPLSSLFCPKNIVFAIFMLFLVIWANMSPTKGPLAGDPATSGSLCIPGNHLNCRFYGCQHYCSCSFLHV